MVKKINLRSTGLIALITLLGTGCQKETGIIPKEERIIENTTSNLDRIKFTNDMLLGSLFYKHRTALRIHNSDWSSSQARDNFKSLIRTHVNNPRIIPFKASYGKTKNASFYYGAITPSVQNMVVITDEWKNIIGMERLSNTDYTNLQKTRRRDSAPN